MYALLSLPESFLNYLSRNDQLWLDDLSRFETLTENNRDLISNVDTLLTSGCFSVANGPCTFTLITGSFLVDESSCKYCRCLMRYAPTARPLLEPINYSGTFHALCILMPFRKSVEDRRGAGKGTWRIQCKKARGEPLVHRFWNGFFEFRKGKRFLPCFVSRHHDFATTETKVRHNDEVRDDSTIQFSNFVQPCSIMRVF